MRDEPRYLINGLTLGPADAGLQAALADVYGSSDRPRCMCVRGGVEMYVARHSLYVIKRMPGTGNLHHPSCEAYETDYGLSGLGALLGEAVIEHAPDQVELRLDFALSMRAGRAPPAGAGSPPPEVKVEARRMSMRALTHYLFEKAGFNRWAPAMAGKRNQAVIHKYLMEAAAEVAVKGAPLADRLLVPEAFSEARRAIQAEQRRRRLAPLYGQGSASEQPMALVLGEFKESSPSSSGRKVIIRHMPELPLFIQEKAWSKLEKMYAPWFAAIEAADAEARQRPRLILCALVYALQEHRFQIATACCMLTTANWIPIDGAHELQLMEALTAQQRRFVKPLRYDAPTAGQFANVLLLDSGDGPVALHVVSAFMDPKDRMAKQRVLTEAEHPWTWHTDQPMPDLPPLRSR